MTHDAPGHTGDPGLVTEAGEAGVEGTDGVVEGRHRAMMPVAQAARLVTLVR
jgi:hypothetical protein